MSDDNFMSVICFALAIGIILDILNKKYERDAHEYKMLPKNDIQKLYDIFIGTFSIVSVAFVYLIIFIYQIPYLYLTMFMSFIFTTVFIFDITMALAMEKSE